MAAKPKVVEGDVIAVPFGERRIAAGIVLHVSKLFRNGILVGFYDRVFAGAAEIDLDTLGGPFIGVPNYTGKQMVRDGDWPVVGNSPKLLASATIPKLRVVNTLYFKDTPVRTLRPGETALYPRYSGQGMGYVQETLRRHFGDRSS